MSKVSVNKSPSLRGETKVPGDKSISHRSLMFGAIANGETHIRGLLKGEDNMSTLKAFRAMGIEITEREGTVLVKGKGLHGLSEPGDVLDAGNSGTTIRLMSGLLAGQSFYSVMTGDRYQRVRPMKRVIEPLTQMGARIYGRDGGRFAPLSIVGTQLKGIAYDSPVASAQVKSSIILAGLYADGLTSVTEPTLSRDHTERMLGHFGVKLDRQGMTVSIKGGQELSAGEIIVPGDISSAAFLIVAALIVKGSELKIKDVGVNPTRTGIVDVLKAMGGDITLENERVFAGEPVADIVIRSSHLKGVEIGGDLIPRLIDEVPVLAVAAAMAEGKTKITGARELRVKESDRIKTVSAELSKFGTRIEELDDGMVIEGRESLSGCNINSYGDHRIAMAMAVAGLIADGETVIDGSEAIDVSFPGFFEALKGLT
ncbi:MAG: 3-phosphoshikimate 1-carboxyvinyltransferase [Proteobacteria bacterium]|nr:3-phosphoshikimate 1-carboxyvinyltransferase [Pseudomonadota bacterium]